MAFRPPKKPTLTLDANLVQDDLPLEVISKIYVGSIHSAFNLEMLECYGITHILNASRLPVTFPKQFTYLSVEIRDKGESNILSCIPTTNIFIEAAIDSSSGGGGVLVHCFGGKSRSPAFIAAYLMSSLSWSFDQAYNLIKAARPTVDINAGFECQLRAYGAANYDVYVAQQLLLRTRIRALYPLKGNEAFLSSVEAKASERIASTRSSLNTRVGNSSTNNAAYSGGAYTKHDSDPDKATGPEESTLHFALSSTGQKRSWQGQDDKTSSGDINSVECKDGTDTCMDVSLGGGLGLRSMSTDMEESAAMADLEKQQQRTQLLQGGAGTSANMSTAGGLMAADSNSDHNSIAFRSDTSPMNTGISGSNSSSYSSGMTINTAAGSGIPSKTPRAKGGRVNRGGRSLKSDADVEAKTPTCRLSRPGSSWVRVIPPLRGLEREFKCSWCNIALFSLANVIRTDLDVVSLLDTAVRAEEKEQFHSRTHTPRLEAMDMNASPSPTAGARTLGAASGMGSFHSRNLHSAGGSRVSFPEMGPPTPRTTAAALARANLNSHNTSISTINNNNNDTQSNEDCAMVLQTPKQTPRGVGDSGMFPSLNVITPRTAGAAGQMFAPSSFRLNNNNISTQEASSPSLGAMDVEMEVDNDDGDDLADNASPKHSYAYQLPMKSSRAQGGGAGAKGFSFDIPLMDFGDAASGSGIAGGGNSGGAKASPDSKSNTCTGSARSGGNLTARSSGGTGILITSPTSTGKSPRASARDGPPLSARLGSDGFGSGSSVSFASDSKYSGTGSSGAKSGLSVSVGGSSRAGLLTSSSYGAGPSSSSCSALPLIHPGNVSSRPSSANTTTFAYNQYMAMSGGVGLYDDSPRIQIPAHRMNESWSPSERRPQSAEKRRWLARVNLLREVPDSKASKLADDDDAASFLGAYGEDKYFYIEYLDWMGKDLFRAHCDMGDIQCFNCHKVVGSYIWKPSVRLTLNSKLEPPLFKIHKHVVHQTDWVFDATPKSTPRPSDGAGHGHLPGDQRPPSGGSSL